jgi:5-oxoprolinase (ATP-hydrolysing)
MPITGRWRVWIDTGGTFTDGLAVAPDGSERRAKILSSGALRGRLRQVSEGEVRLEARWSFPAAALVGFRLRAVGGADTQARILDAKRDSERLFTLRISHRLTLKSGDSIELFTDEDAPLVAARLLLGVGAEEALPDCDLRLATTRGTNALLQRNGSRTALFVTRGFGDLGQIRDQQRPELFTLNVQLPRPLYEQAVEVDERLDASGRVLRPLDLGSIRADARRLLERGVRSAAICLLHSYRNPEHEERLADELHRLGFEYVARSAELTPFIKLLPRLETAVADAYLGPDIDAYLGRIHGASDSPHTLVMTSAGGLIDPASYRAKDSLLSGPAAGVVGAVHRAKELGDEQIIGFDMGGTSTDVSRYDRRFEYVYEHQVGEIKLAAPALAIESVAAGGGSICWLDDGRLRVGPRSAGADPGPACYGAGGPLTVTDLNLLLGRLEPSQFGIPVDPVAARDKLQLLADELSTSTGDPIDPMQMAVGLLTIADETMADAIRRISVRRGFTTDDDTLVAFGGAGGQHAVGVAERLGMRRILIPRDAALLSAVGLGRAAIERFAEQQLIAPLGEVEATLQARWSELESKAIAAVRVSGAKEVEIRRRILRVRWRGREATLDLEWRPKIDVGSSFRNEYERLYGHSPGAGVIEVESMRVIAGSVEMRADRTDGTTNEVVQVQPQTPRDVWFDGAPVATSTLQREQLPPGSSLAGPALIVEAHSATVLPPNWDCEVTHAGLLLTRGRGTTTPSAAGETPDAVQLELFTQRFSALVGEMGERLERTSTSTNVKERLDFSCALLDHGGRLVVNAPHIPVHLGALGLCVRRLDKIFKWKPGDVAVTNHPAFGGSHLPDVTVVTPVFMDRQTVPIGFVASRAHHAEIGGVRPGSMPPHATCLEEEGVVIEPTLLYDGGAGRWEAMTDALQSARYPSRALDENLSDLRAAVAANHAGATRLRQLADDYSSQTIDLYMQRLSTLSSGRLQRALRDYGDGTYSATERLDDGTAISATIEVAQGRATVDFSGSGAVHSGNLNATPAIVQSALLYVLRLLIRDPMPLNEGLLDQVELVIPTGLLNPDFDRDPARCPAVVGGNVETSQRIVDTLLRALRLAACSQGTMNNVIFGNAHYGYYETIGGGVGAHPTGAGASGVHSHMTNTRITDPEILESRYPVRLERFSLRCGSGGAGRHRGGDGLVREIRFLEATSLSILSQHRITSPYGLEGGSNGLCGEQWLLRADGSEERLAGISEIELQPNDRLRIMTPGGGGFGRDN